VEIKQMVPRLLAKKKAGIRTNQAKADASPKNMKAEIRIIRELLKEEIGADQEHLKVQILAMSSAYVLTGWQISHA
jgi:hypothetical protein